MKSDEETLLETRLFRVVRLQQRNTDGTTHRREVIRHPGAVTILPILEGNHVCLIRNYRVSVDQTLIELPAGTLEAKEDPRLAAERELIEETGYRAAKLEHLHSFFLSPGILDEQMRLFLATGLTPGDTAREPGEQIENLIVPWDTAMEMIADGRIQDAKTIVGLLYYDRLRATVQ